MTSQPIHPAMQISNNDAHDTVGQNDQSGGRQFRLHRIGLTLPTRCRDALRDCQSAGPEIR